MALRWPASIVAACLLAICARGQAQIQQKVVDVPSRPGVTQRLLVLTPPAAVAAVVLFAGGHGGLQISSVGSLKWGRGNFLIRSSELFAQQGLVVAIVDAPSDRQSAPFLQGFRQTPEHVADIKAVIAWLRETAKLPVWLIGTSRGTQSAAFVATQLAGADAPDGIVLTSTILTDRKGRPVPEMALETLSMPVLVVHHEQDGCELCAFANIPDLMRKLDHSARKQLLAFKGGESHGDPCEAMAYHGFNGLEREVVQQVAAWMRP